MNYPDTSGKKFFDNEICICNHGNDYNIIIPPPPKKKEIRDS